MVASVERLKLDHGWTLPQKITTDTGMVAGHKINVLQWQSECLDLKPIEILRIEVGSLLHEQT